MKVTLTAIKTTTIALTGTVASAIAGSKVTDLVYQATNDYSKASAAGTMVGVAGLGGTAAVALAVVDHDVANYTDEDMKQIRKVSHAMNTVSEGMKTISNALKIAACIAR